LPLGEQSKVLLDTSILLAVQENRARVFEGIKKMLGKVEFFVPSSVTRELEIVGSRKGKKQAYIIARKVIEENKVREIEDQNLNADEFLAEHARKGFIVATNDSALKKRIKGFGGRIIYLKKGTLIEIE